MVTRCAEPVWEQMSLFAPAQESPVKFPNLRMVGDTVGRLVLAADAYAAGSDRMGRVDGIPGTGGINHDM